MNYVPNYMEPTKVSTMRVSPKRMVESPLRWNETKRAASPALPLLHHKL